MYYLSRAQIWVDRELTELFGGLPNHREMAFPNFFLYLKSSPSQINVAFGGQNMIWWNVAKTTYEQYLKATNKIDS